MRENWDMYFMGFARQAATRATCPRGAVGAVFVRDRNLLATGYNGSVSGAPHCDEYPEELHVVNGHCDIAVHAEINGLAQAAKHGTCLEGATLYCTHRPCWRCLRPVLTAGVRRIVYEQEYRPDPKVTELCVRLGVPLTCLK